MDIGFFTWEITEPVRRRPIAGVLTGLVTGLVFGVMAREAPNAAPSIVLGYSLGGAAAGVLIGSFLPLFRRRIWAGIVVAAAASVAFLIVHHVAADGFPIGGSILIGCCSGFAYALLFWKYTPD